MESICAKCIHLHGEAKRQPWYHWLCTQWPIDVHTNYVSGESTPPYKACKFINDGACKMFEEGRNCLTKEKPDGNSNSDGEIR